MKSLYNKNGLIFWTEREIKLRKMFEDYFQSEMKTALLATNPAWTFHQMEAPTLTPTEFVSNHYTPKDMFMVGKEFVLRPETTMGSYRYIEYLLKEQSVPEKPPFVIWQVGKSFRQEQDQATKYMRLKEFYQQEFQCVYTADTKNDYQAEMLKPVQTMISDLVSTPSRIVESNRRPDYSSLTMDIELYYQGRWLEVCSISKRTDLETQATFSTKKKTVTKDLEVLEVAIGLDRCVPNFDQR